AALDLGAGLGAVRAGPLGRELRGNHLVHHRDVGLDTEDLLGQVDAGARTAVGLLHLGLHAASTSGPRARTRRARTSGPPDLRLSRALMPSPALSPRCARTRGRPTRRVWSPSRAAARARR